MGILVAPVLWFAFCGFAHSILHPQRRTRDTGICFLHSCTHPVGLYVAVVIDEENGRLRWIVGFGRILTGGKPLTEYVRAECDETHTRRVKLLSMKTHTFVELYQPEAFCEEMNRAIKNNKQD